MLGNVDDEPMVKRRGERNGQTQEAIEQNANAPLQSWRGTARI